MFLSIFPDRIMEKNHCFLNLTLSLGERACKSQAGVFILLSLSGLHN